MDNLLDAVHLDQESTSPDLVVFFEPESACLTIPSGIDASAWATHLAFISAREPHNLLNHVRRVRLHAEEQQGEALFGALLDLFLVLGCKGRKLRARLLRQSKKQLSPGRYLFFKKNFNQGLQSNQSLPPCQYSVLGNFFRGDSLLVVDEELACNSGSNGLTEDPLEAAREELNYGDVAVAQKILEKALLSNPERVSLHYGLLEVYKHTRCLEDLFAMQAKLGDRLAVAELAWRQTRKQIEAKIK